MLAQSLQDILLYLFQLLLVTGFLLSLVTNNGLCNKYTHKFIRVQYLFIFF